MRVLSPLQIGVLQKPFTFTGRNFLCVSLTWAFRIDSGQPVLETEMWQALTDFLGEGRIFDQSMPKACGEFLCAGTFHAPGGQPVAREAVSVRVGDREKRLLVTGPREWRTGGATRPEPIASMPVRYGLAFGGEGFPDNPTGMGYAVDAEGRHPLPRIEYPDEAVSSPSQRPRPGSFEGRDMGWRSRQRYAGTYDDDYLRTRMPGLADDTDWHVFNDAAEDQWFDGFLRGDEAFELIHMHPEQPRLRGQLPGVRARAFIHRRREPDRRNSALEFREIPLKPDTIWLLPDSGLGVVIHRGTTEVSLDDATDVVSLLAATEGPADPPRSREHYRDELERRSDPDEGYRYMLDTRALLPLDCPCAIQEMAANSPMDRQNTTNTNLQAFADNQRDQRGQEAAERVGEARQQIGTENELQAGGVDGVDDQLQLLESAAGGGTGNTEEPDAELQRILERIAPGMAQGQDVDLAKIDFDGFDELSDWTQRMADDERARARRTMEEQLDDLRKRNDPGTEELDKAIRELEDTLRRMDLPPPLPRPADQDPVARMEEQLAALSEYREQLEQAGLDETQIRDAIPDLEALREQSDAAVQGFASQYREGAHMIGEATSPHPGQESERRALLIAANSRGERAAGGDYAFIDLRGVVLRDLDLSNAYLEYVDFTGATLSGVNLSGAILAHARLDDCRCEHVDFSGANVGATKIDGAAFSHCDFDRAILGRARIARTAFDHCTFTHRREMFLESVLSRVRFAACGMPGLAFIENDLTGCAFRECDLAGAAFIQCKLAHADFSAATLSSANIVTTPAPGACFDDARMDQVRFIDEPTLNDCTFRRANLTGANLREADLAGADFSRARLEGADFSDSDLSGANLQSVRATGAQFRKAELERARLDRADLREASLMNARIRQARFNGANLYSVSFLNATLGDTGFSGANLDNTILRDWRPWRG